MASVVEKSFAISVKSPIGMNSEVLKIKATQINPIRCHPVFFLHHVVRSHFLQNYRYCQILIKEQTKYSDKSINFTSINMIFKQLSLCHKDLSYKEYICKHLFPHWVYRGILLEISVSWSSKRMISSLRWYIMSSVLPVIILILVFLNRLLQLKFYLFFLS